MKVFCAILILLAAASAHAQITTIPPNPVAGVPFTIHIVQGTCPISAGPATVNGTNIDINITFADACGTFPPGVFDVPAGPLPAGSYMVQLHNVNNGGAVFATQPIVVSADIPALDPRLLAVLAAMLAALGLRFATR
jgi:hypothetical protein